MYGEARVCDRCFHRSAGLATYHTIAMQAGLPANVIAGAGINVIAASMSSHSVIGTAAAGTLLSAGGSIVHGNTPGQPKTDKLTVTADGVHTLLYPSDASLSTETNRHVSSVGWELCSDVFPLLPHGRTFSHAALLEIPLRANAKRAIRQRRRFVLLNKATDTAPWEILENREHGLLVVIDDIARAKKMEFCYVQVACEEAEPPEQQELPETVESLEPEPEKPPEPEPEDESVHLNTVINEGVPVQLRQAPRVCSEHAYFSVYAPVIRAGISFEIDVWVYTEAKLSLATLLASHGLRYPLGSHPYGNQLNDGCVVRFQLLLDDDTTAFEVQETVQRKRADWTTQGPNKVSFQVRCMHNAPLDEYGACVKISRDGYDPCCVRFRLKVEPSSRPITPPKEPKKPCIVTGLGAAEAQREHPRWVADEEAIKCMCCQNYFGRIWGRKHHCR
jgi:hypothetical protein